MSTTQILQGKHALVFGAGGSVGAAVATELAAEGAEVFLSGRHPSNVEEVAKRVTDAGGRAHCAVLDASNEAAVDAYVDAIAKRAGSVDIVFNAVGPLVAEYGNGKPAVELSVEEFMVPLTTIVRPLFLTARAAARRMVEQRSGVILFLTGSPARAHVHGATAIGTAFGAIETFSRNLAFEVGPAGVRVTCLRSTAMPDTRTIQQTLELLGRRMNVPAREAGASLANMTMLKVSPTTSDTAKVLAFLGSDRARMVTGTVVNASGGAVAD
jgi:NAD(P)-dependent dehydrogenase (short-subunit alcohol dehydrogenase family)